MPKTHNISTATIRGLWNNWAIGFGAIALVMVLSLLLPIKILPWILIALAYGLMVKMRSDHSNPKMGACYMLVWVMALVLFWSAIVMIVINLLHAEWFFGVMMAIEPFNPDLPYLPCLIVFPTALIISSYFLIRGHSSRICRNCQARFGYYEPDGIVARLYNREARYQLKLMMWLSLLLSIVDWTYYYFFYINVNLNQPDKFYFIVVPVAIYVLSLVYMLIRYMSMAEDMIEEKSKSNVKPMMTLVRYLVLANDRLLVTETTDERTDTPAKMIIPRRENMTVGEAAKGFADMSGVTDFETKYLYTDTGYVNGANVIHYAVFLPDDNTATRLQGQWITIDELDREIKSSRIAPLLARELSRIYNVTMAWKTYDINGNRLYPIKHYRPTFRLRDLKKWEVDYSDLRWLNIATNNEDRPFFRLRKLWRKNFRH